ncbi:hypothetical protein, partial [Bacillus sp. SIMBA_033]|uniref:hypothetical protein n=1 Tax=Bacillus sp. SIMBA_033 TaxID=3085776 RepID=UPI003979ED2B
SRRRGGLTIPGLFSGWFSQFSTGSGERLTNFNDVAAISHAVFQLRPQKWRADTIVQFEGDLCSFSRIESFSKVSVKHKWFCAKSCGDVTIRVSVNRLPNVTEVRDNCTD